MGGWKEGRQMGGWMNGQVEEWMDGWKEEI